MHRSQLPGRRRRTASRHHSGRAAIAAAGLVVLCGAPYAGARTGDGLREGVRNGTTNSETEIIANIRTTTAAKGGFAMRMSNLSATGGGFVNGCRASAAATSKPCYRASNLSDGRAFEFNSNNGLIVGTITAGAGGDTKKPFTTNATGVATGLNADRVDNLDAAAIIAAARAKTGLAAATADTAADADKLDGLDSTAFAQGGLTTRITGGFALTGANTVVRSLSLPPGAYMVWGKVFLDNDAAAATGELPCRLMSGATQIDRSLFNLDVDGAIDDDEVISLLAATTVAATTTLELQCSEAGGGNIEVFDAVLSAIKVGGVS